MYRWYRDTISLLEPGKRHMLPCVMVGCFFWCFVAYLFWDFATFWYFAGEDHFILPPWIDQRKHYYSQHHLGHFARKTVLQLVHGSENSYQAAHRYYLEQRPLFERAAREFELHPAFKFGAVEVPAEEWGTFYDMVSTPRCTMYAAVNVWRAGDTEDEEYASQLGREPVGRL